MTENSSKSNDASKSAHGEPSSDDRGLMTQLWPYLRRYKWQVVIGMLFIFSCAYIEVTIPKLIGEIVDILRPDDAAVEAAASATASAASLAAPEIGGDNGVRSIAVTILGLAIINAISLFSMRRLMIGASRDIEVDMRRDFFGHLLRLSPTFYDVERTGDVMERASSDMDAVRMWLGPGIMHLTRTIVFLPFALYRLFSVSVFLTVTALLPFLLIAWMTNFFGRAIYKRSRAAQDQMSRLGAMVQESFAGIRVVKAFGQEKAQLEHFADLNGELITRNLGVARIQAAFFPFMHAMGAVGFLIVVWIGSYLIINGGLTFAGMAISAITVGQLVQFVFILGILIWPMMALGWSINLYQRAKASMNRIQRVLRAKLYIEDAASEADEEFEGISTELKVRGLTFAYPNPPSIASDSTKKKKDFESGDSLPPALRARRDQVRRERREMGGAESEEPRRTDDDGAAIVLEEIEFALAPGKTLGVVGPIGSGKSTLARLLGRFYPVPRGAIALGGRDVNDLPLSLLRRKIGYVFQETFLFSDSIMENIRFGAPDASDEDVISACKTAALHDDIEGFPKGYETMLGERGINLSGGQKQRAAIARALVYDPDILILDDALSAVDTQTEAAILHALREANADRTVIIIAHRLSTLRDADEIIVLDDGRIIERGDHAGLLEQEGLYARIWEDQQLAQEIEAGVGE